VRIPIAKQEPPQAFPADHSFPNGALKQEKGLGWGVREDEIIFYVDLLDSLLNTLFSYTDPANT